MILRQWLLICSVLVLGACKHPLVIIGEGDIVDVNGGGFGCTLEQFQAGSTACSVNAVAGDYSVRYQAVPRPGWRFVRWEGVPCAYYSESPDCQFDWTSEQVELWDSVYPDFDTPATVAVFEPFNDALDLFVSEVSSQVIQTQCIACHIDGGLSSHTRLVFLPDSEAGYQEHNFQQFVELAEDQAATTDYVLGKVQGVGHGGGVQLTPGSSGFIAMENFLTLLTGDSGSGGGEGLFADYTLADGGETLRRAAVIAAGVVPAPDEIQNARNAGDEQLRAMLRGLLTGEGFHKFLIEGANDRLLTDKWIDNRLFNFREPYYPDLANYFYDQYLSGEVMALRGMRPALNYGFARSPLELIAFVVENDKPYTEILTADYTMVNPGLKLPYRADVEFEDESNMDQWLPAEVEGYVRIDTTTSYERGDVGAKVSGGLATDYPHAGVLNTPGWLARYPSTDTNRNRARARWTWYHFLGVDIERLASRTTDPEALADTDNPTLKNPNCTVCHEVLDPLAGSYQNYGDDGFYKDQPLGMDSLPRLYKRDNTPEDPYQFGDVWYRDMRAPGFGDTPLTNTDQTLAELAAQIVQDPRFASGTVKFWWPALTGEEALTAPENTEDVDYAERLAVFEAQSEFIESLALQFANGIGEGAPFNLRDLMVEIMMSPWFRADGRVVQSEDVEEGPMLGIGSGKLLTPEQLDRKTEAITGFRWFVQENNGVEVSQLDGTYRLFYGGIDSDGVTQRATEMTALMSTVVEAQPLQLGCVLVAVEFNTPRAQRRLFTTVGKDDVSEDLIREQLVVLHEKFLGEEVSVTDPQIDIAYALFTETRAERMTKGFDTRLNGTDEACPFQFIPVAESLDLTDPEHTLNTWVSMMIYYMTDFRYVYD